MKDNLDRQFIKVKRKYRANDIFIAPLIQVTDIEFSDVELILGVGKYTCEHLNDYKVFFRKIDFSGNAIFIDLETGIIYQDESQIDISSKGKKYIRTSELIPMSKFISKKYQNKLLKTADLIELADDIITDMKDSKQADLEYIDYNMFFLADIYQFGNKLKDKAVIYQYGNNYIDIDSKEVYYNEKQAKNNKNYKYVKTETLIPLKEYISNPKMDDSKVLTKKNNIK